MVDMATAGMEGMAAMVDMEAAWASTLASVRESSTEESVADMAVMVSTANHLHHLRGYYQQYNETRTIQYIYLLYISTWNYVCNVYKCVCACEYLSA